MNNQATPKQRRHKIASRMILYGHSRGLPFFGLSYPGSGNKGARTCHSALVRSEGYIVRARQMKSVQWYSFANLFDLQVGY